MRIAILGAGKLGKRIAKALLDGDYDITIVDTKEEKLNQLSQMYDFLPITGDAKSIDTLKEMEIKSYDFLFSCTTSDEVNIISASFAKKLGCKTVAARVRDPEHMNQTELLREHFDIDLVVNPDLLITAEIYRYLIEKYSISDGIYSFKNISLVELEASKHPKLIGKSLIDFRKTMEDLIMVGISRNGKMIIPHGNDEIMQDDLLYIVGETSRMKALNKKTPLTRRKNRIKKVMIIGGGKTGFYLAKKLSEFGAYVKIVEIDKKRCNYLTDKLNNVMVINGNGADISLLEEENIDEMDAFVTATGYDEENLLLALSAKTRGIEDVISKVSHESYKVLIEKLGIDVVLNPLDITASAILRRIRGTKRVLSSVILQGQAELMEVYAQEGMRMINVPLKDFDLPDYIIIATIIRKGNTIIPDGNTRILPGDRVIIVCSLSGIGYVEKLFKPNVLFNILK